MEDVAQDGHQVHSSEYLHILTSSNGAVTCNTEHKYPISYGTISFISVAVQQVEDLSRATVRAWQYNVLKIALEELRVHIPIVLNETASMNPDQLSCRGLESVMRVVRWAGRFAMMRSAVIAAGDWNEDIYDMEMDNHLELLSFGEGPTTFPNSADLFLEANRWREFFAEGEDIKLIVIN